MPFQLTLAQTGASQPLSLALNAGEILFVLGANGTGKSSLMYTLFVQHAGAAKRVVAHRQGWLESNAVGLTPQQRAQHETWFRQISQQSTSRWKDEASQQRTQASVFDLVASENQRARKIGQAADADDMTLVRALAAKDAPLKVINQILNQSNINITISIGEGETIDAVKDGSPKYSIAELSDGERNALLVATEVLTAKEGTLILIDEPERHLHRSIISPLLTQLFACRPDCAFIISTHEVALPVDNPTARTLLVRNCSYSQRSTIASWQLDLVPPGAAMDETLLKDILGSRKKIVFVEGTEGSLDKPLYSLIFPNVSVIPKASCRDVENAVIGLRDANALNWVRAYGIVDNDNRVASDIEVLKAKGIYAVSVFSVESIYYHPDIQTRISTRQSAVDGGDAQSRLQNAKRAALAAVVSHVDRLSRRVVEKEIRDRITRQLPGQPEIQAGGQITINIDIASVIAAEKTKLLALLTTEDITAIIARYPIRETTALGDIATKLGFTGRKQYESAVRKLLVDEPTVTSFVRSLFGSLAVDIASV